MYSTKVKFWKVGDVASVLWWTNVSELDCLLQRLIRMVTLYGPYLNIIEAVWSLPHSYPTATQQVPNKYPTSTQQVHELVSIMNDNEYSVKEIMSILNLKDRVNFLRNYLTPALDEGLVSMKFPEQPKHPKQKYLLTSKGKAILSE